MRTSECPLYASVYNTAERKLMRDPPPRSFAAIFVPTIHGFSTLLSACEACVCAAEWKHVFSDSREVTFVARSMFHFYVCVKETPERSMIASRSVISFHPHPEAKCSCCYNEGFFFSFCVFAALRARSCRPGQFTQI